MLRRPYLDCKCWDFWQHAVTSDVDIVIKVAGDSSTPATFPGHSPVLRAASPAWKVRQRGSQHDTHNAAGSLAAVKHETGSIINNVLTTTGRLQRHLQLRSVTRRATDSNTHEQTAASHMPGTLAVAWPYCSSAAMQPRQHTLLAAVHIRSEI
jgi:hypothetical protein